MLGKQLPRVRASALLLFPGMRMNLLGSFQLHLPARHNRHRECDTANASRRDTSPIWTNGSFVLDISFSHLLCQIVAISPGESVNG